MTQHHVIVVVGTFLGGVVALSDDLRRRHARLLRTAIALSELRTIDRAAREAEMDAAQFTRQLELLEGSHARLAKQPPSFWQWYAVLLAQEFGLPKETRIGRRLARAALGRKRMARMDSTDRRTA